MRVKTEQCLACNHAHDHGWWGTGTLPKDTDAHCRVCHQAWSGTGNRWGHCNGCHITFRGVTAFDRHQMVTGCPDTTVDITGALRSSSAALKADGKRHLVEYHDDMRGHAFWGWNGTNPNG